MPFADLAFLALIVAFFAVALLLVRGCELIIGSDETATATPLPADSGHDRELAA